MVSKAQTVHPPVRHLRSGRIRAIGGNIMGFFDSVGRIRKAAEEYQRLSLLSDEQLAARGLSRGTLPQQAFRDYLIL